MKTRAILLCLALIGGSRTMSAPDPTVAWTQKDTFVFAPVAGPIPAPGAQIESHGTGPTRFAGNGQTGDLYVRYTDGVKVVVWKAPDKKVIMPAEGREDDEQIGVDQIKTAGNRRTVGWTDMAAPCCESYPLPVSVGIYQSGKQVLHIGGPGMLDYWHFMDDGRQLVTVWGPAHGPEILEYQIIDLKLNRVVADVLGDPKTQELASNAPKWALQAQAAIEAR